MKFTDQYIKRVDQLNKVIFGVIGIMLMFIFILLIVQVYFRFIANASLSWPEEAAKFLTIWSVFLGVSISLRQKGLIAVEALLERARGKFKKILSLITLSISFIFCLFLVYYGFEMAAEVATRKSSAALIPMWIPFLSIPIGGCLTILNIVVVAIELFTKDEELGVDA
ncbi:TRAP transporter small permease [Alkalihalobacillus oceani]|uniref:TRAP transporter small permease n=1 Tax=Halalkalibacter oceani TaxID=1653776 RepID=UPI00203FF434|nr:TRAP transporter small permease [Halalkalibacter oceani]MCM3763240.1 TRAP transporter small permease [Halalkalibacter oceani]